MARAGVSVIPAAQCGRLRRAVQGLRPSDRLDQLQDQERRAGVLAHSVDLHDAGVVQPRHGLGLRPGTANNTSGVGQGRAAVQHLHRDLVGLSSVYLTVGYTGLA